MKWHAWVLLVLCISQPTMASEKKEAEATVPAVEDRLTTGETNSETAGEAGRAMLPLGTTAAKYGYKRYVPSEYLAETENDFPAIIYLSGTTQPWSLHPTVKRFGSPRKSMHFWNTSSQPIAWMRIAST